MSGARSIIKTSLGDVEYAELGSGPPLLSFHGTPGGCDGALLAAALHCGEGFRVIGFSRPGYLRTPLTAGSSVPEQADLAAVLLDALGMDAALVYGLSGGGPFALEFAARHPRRCRALVLGAAVTAPEPRSMSRLKLEVAGLYLLTPLAWLLKRLAPASELAQVVSVLTPFGPREAGYRNDATVFGNFVPIQLERIECPVLMVHGTRDRAASFEDARRCSIAIRNCSTVFVRGAGHMTIWWKLEVKKRIREFLWHAVTFPLAGRHELA